MCAGGFIVKSFQVGIRVLQTPWSIKTLQLMVEAGTLETKHTGGRLNFK